PAAEAGLQPGQARTSGITGSRDMTEIGRAISRFPHPDDIAVWPDGTCPHLGEIPNGGFNFLSDVDEVVDIDDRAASGPSALRRRWVSRRCLIAHQLQGRIFDPRSGRDPWPGSRFSSPERPSLRLLGPPQARTAQPKC